jgi:selenocysteine lyase/cysteine desulfurase
MEPHIIYMNNAAEGWPKAPGVAQALECAVRETPAHAFRASVDGPDLLCQCRASLAALLGGVDPSRVVISSCATHAINLALSGLRWSAGDRTVTTLTEHNSVLRPLRRLRHSANVETLTLDVDNAGDIDLAAADAALERGVRLVAVTHMSNVTGHVLDVASLFRRAHAHGALTLLDASQSMGALEVHPERLGADMVAFSGHKCLHGATGTGVLYVAPHVELEPSIVGGTGVRSDLEEHPRDMPTRLEAGTPNTVGVAGLLAASEWARTRGPDFIASRRACARRLHDRLAELPKLRLLSGTEDAERSGIVSFCADGWSVAEVGFVLARSFGVIGRTGLHCAPLIHKRLGIS